MLAKIFRWGKSDSNKQMYVACPKDRSLQSYLHEAFKVTSLWLWTTLYLPENATGLDSYSRGSRQFSTLRLLLCRKATLIVHACDLSHISAVTLG